MEEEEIILRCRKQIIKFTPFFCRTVGKLFLAANSEEEKDAILTLLHPKLFAVDATDIPVEGQKGYSMRLHVCYDVETKKISENLVTSHKQAETFRNFKQILPDSIYMADRVYGRAKSLAYLAENGAGYLVRVTPSHITFYYDRECRRKVHFSSLLSGTPLSERVYYRYQEKRTVNGRKVTENKVYETRLVAVEIPEEKWNNVERRTNRLSQKKQHKLKEVTLLYSHYVILVTTLRENEYSAEELAMQYRLRWQIEILFRRSKGAFQFHAIHHATQEYYLLRVRLWVAIMVLASDLCSLVGNLSPSPIFQLFVSLSA